MLINAKLCPSILAECEKIATQLLTGGAHVHQADG